MKTTRRWTFWAIIAILGIITLSLAACKNEPDTLPPLLPKTPVADDFTVEGIGIFPYDGNPKTVTVQAKDGKTTGDISVKYSNNYGEWKTAPSATGTYTVTFDVAAATGWNAASGFSAGTLTVTFADLAGTLTISPSGTVLYTDFMILTATYSGTETVSYQWNKDRTAIDGVNSDKFIPTEPGIYTVTLNAAGYNSKTSNVVTVIGTWKALWAEAPFGTSTIKAIAYGNNKFVAGGGGGKMATSTNGTKWTAVTNSAFGTYYDINTIAYGNNKFVAGGDDGRIIYSSGY